eukprot:6195782-Pleurochrysis_carterae.AAC.1
MPRICKASIARTPSRCRLRRKRVHARASKRPAARRRGQSCSRLRSRRRLSAQPSGLHFSCCVSLRRRDTTSLSSRRRGGSRTSSAAGASGAASTPRARRRSRARWRPRCSRDSRRDAPSSLTLCEATLMPSSAPGEVGHGLSVRMRLARPRSSCHSDAFGTRFL